MKNIKDYLHLYLGCEIFTGTGTVTLLAVQAESPVNNYRVIVLNGNQIHELVKPLLDGEGAKPILRPLSDMTEEEATYLAELYSRWAWRKEFEMKSLDCTDKSAFITIYYVLEGGPHGIGDGEYTEQLVVSEGSIWARGYVERNDYRIVLESHEMHRYLLSKHFDLFNLISDGLAIDSTTIK